jgi:transcriptional regulator with XRE-family HTH domain
MSEEKKRQLAQRLRDAREASGLSQEEVAKKLGLPRPAISQLENGHRRVEALELARLAKLYERPLGFFADEEAPGSERLESLQRAASDLSEKDREEVLRFAEYLRQRAADSRKRR